MMNSSLNFIFQRRSVRKYLDKEISSETLQDLMEAAMAAPSACAKDPWHFIVMKDKAALKAAAEFLPNGKMLGSAAAGIVVCGDIKRAHAEEVSFMLQDCSAAIENILLAAAALGIGSCWLGVHPRPERIESLSAYFKLPKNIIPISAIALGYPVEKHEARTRFRKEAVHFEKWREARA